MPDLINTPNFFLDNLYISNMRSIKKLYYFLVGLLINEIKKQIAFDKQFEKLKNAYSEDNPFTFLSASARHTVKELRIKSITLQFLRQ